MSAQTRPSKGAIKERQARAERVAAAQRRARRRLLLRTAIATLAVGLVLFLVFQSGRGGGSGGSGPRFDVGTPGPGAEAPPIRLASTTGGTYDLQTAAGKTVLLYFQEGLMCQPCWDQIRDIESDPAAFKALGIDEMVSITSDPLDLVRQKVADEGIKTPVLSDPELTLAQSYNANRYGMMGLGRYGHSFILVGSDGRIRWRADYGGPPNHTMYVKVSDLVKDVRAGLGTTS